MPYRQTPPLQRPWWEKLTGLWMATIAGMGIAGLLWPSTYAPRLNIDRAVFSLLLAALGVAALAAWWRGARSPERIFMVGIALLSLIHGVGYWVFADNGGGTQAGLRIIAAGIGTLAWVGIRHEFGLSRTQVQNAVVAHVEDDDDGEG